MPGWFSVAFGINNAGEIVGESNASGGMPHAFLYENGVMTDLNSLLPAGSGWTLDYATAVNDAGEIVGWGTIDGETHAFRLDPSPSVPGPSSLVLCCVGAVTLLCYRWRSAPPGTPRPSG
jgi:probable HAF family extracellular repeat protein